MPTWEMLLNDQRRKDAAKEKKDEKPKSIETRTETERDHDRILFSTPVRRLADKTQVFPLEPNDSVRTRLTHSHEVSNLARSIGTNLAFNHQIGRPAKNYERNVPATLAAIGLSHDLGNPPFGHQGETAIQQWFQKNKTLLAGLTPAMRYDFLKFEGNAQTFRLITRLQLLNDNFGLDLTYGTLAGLLKYTVPSNVANKKSLIAGCRKHGFFQSEKDIVNDVWKHTGLKEGMRHPLAYVMEACDDIAYSVLDAEDAVKKGLASFYDLMAFLEHDAKQDADTLHICSESRNKNVEYRTVELAPAELNDVSMQRFRVFSIARMVPSVSKTFLRCLPKIMSGTLQGDLISNSSSERFCSRLKKFDMKHAYRNRSVLKIELEGYTVIQYLMTFLWRAISEREDPSKLNSKRTSPFANYVYNLISENYRRVAEDPNNKMPLRYRELQLMTDMVSGMTDGFAVSLHKELHEYAR